MKNIVYKIFGYCKECGRWFKYPKRRKMNTRYEYDKLNYCRLCKCCYERISTYLEEMWSEYNSGR